MCLLVLVYCHVVHLGGKSSGTSGQDEWRGKGESRRQEPQKVDVNRLPSFLRKGGGNKDNPREVCFIVEHVQCQH